MKTKPAFLRSRVLLFWVCRSDQSFKRLSRNILREVCGYLGNASLIIAVVQDRLFNFLPGKKIWEECMSLSPILPAFSRSSYVLFKEDLFIIGGHNDNLCEVVSRTFRIQADTVRRGPDMLAARCFSGCLQTAGNIYAFGGMDEKALSSCEKLNQENWISLNNMKIARFNFVPCVHQAMVYICGGKSFAVEIFDPSTSLFSVSSFQCGTTITQWTCALISHEEKLVLVGYSWIQKGESIGRSRRGGFTWSSCAPVVVEGVVYFVDNRVAVAPICRGVRLEGGAEVCACPLSIFQS